MDGGRSGAPGPSPGGRSNDYKINPGRVGVGVSRRGTKAGHILG